MSRTAVSNKVSARIKCHLQGYDFSLLFGRYLYRLFHDEQTCYGGKLPQPPNPAR